MGLGRLARAAIVSKLAEEIATQVLVGPFGFLC
jgi:hypothetical protein